MKVKIFGAGSIGNHLANASRKLDWEVDIYDISDDALDRTKNMIYPSRYGNWDENCHRWASKFILPKGTYLTDKKGTSDTSDDVLYWVKPLLGDEFLKVLSGASLPAQARDYSALTKDILGSASDLIDVGPNGTTENYIGAVPTSPLNNGNPSVVHGKVVSAPE